MKAGGSKASLKTTGVGKKNLTPIPEASGSLQRQTPTISDAETTLNRMMESSALGPPPQLPPTQLEQTPLDREWLQLVGQWTKEFQSPGIQPPAGSSPGKKLLWPEYQPWGPHQSPPK
ncbi:uncharacterized protein EV420DRAFT_1643092 [Desarmillaria tabescens]|uniref:Uncharacterized protein n=1 Tax=Armillaria tabescens TaxID=1929756 RepID=A0AA39KBQ0_ARMTA|nr:uncharacterized protein EV420DRAFT_1643092 [Desarmillaria tabescens]KAK0458212.1 hypothetical protein EV420DRAFT_1643092 [Desarmillaria tabescens]